MSRTGPDQFAAFPAHMRVGFGPFRATVEHITDGDSLRVFADIGWNMYRFTVIRLAGIDAPERYRGTDEQRAAGAAALAYLVELLPLGSPVILATEPDPDSFGRYIAWVTLEDGTSLNDRLVAAGHAVYRVY